MVCGGLLFSGLQVEIVHGQAAQRKLGHWPRVVFWLPTLVARKRADWNLARTVTATVVADTPPSVLEMGSISKEAAADVQRVAREEGHAAPSTYVTDDLMNSFTISGDAENICEVFLSLTKLGADEIVIGPPYGRDTFR